MSQEDSPPEEELADRQGPLYPVGKALRRTFDAENHDSLGNDLTGLMLQLARIEPDGAPLKRGAMPVASLDPPAPDSAPTPPASTAPASWWRGAVERFLR